MDKYDQKAAQMWNGQMTQDGLAAALRSAAADALSDEAKNCPEPESVHGIGGYYCKQFVPRQAPPAPAKEDEKR